MKYQNNKSTKLFVDKIFLNVHFSITIAFKDFKFCLFSPHIHSKGTVSQIVDSGLSFYFHVKKREIFSLGPN